MGSPIFRKGLVNGLEWELCEQEEKKGLENNSSLPFMDNLEATQPKNLLRGAVHKPISLGLPYI